jgi:hypothetical protein
MNRFILRLIVAIMVLRIGLMLIPQGDPGRYAPDRRDDQRYTVTVKGV